jgi:hypothetical protein
VTYRVFILFVFAALECSGQRALPFQDGERLSYAFEFGLFDAATAEVTVQDVKSIGQRIFDVQGVSTGAFRWVFKVDDRYTSTVDAATGQPLKFVRDISEGGYQLKQHYRFDWATQAVQTSTSRGDGPTTEAVYTLSQPGHDMVSGLFALRGIDWAVKTPGDTIQIGLFMDEEWFDLRLIHQGYGQVDVAGSTWPTILLQPVVQTGRIWRRSDDLRVHISNDGRYIPLLAETRILFGKIRMELTHASGLRNPAIVSQ